MDSIMENITNDNVRQKYKFLTELLPDVEKTYLLYKCEKYANNPKKLEDFASECCTKQSSTKRQARKFTSNRLIESLYTVDGFLEQIPDPVAYFSNRPLALQGSIEDKNYGIAFLRTHFNENYSKTIRQEFVRNKYDIVKTADAIKNHPKKVITTEHNYMVGLKTDNIELIKQMAYITNKPKFDLYFEKQQEEIKQKINVAKINGTIATCQCCYDEEVIEEKQIICTKNHTFCLGCVNQSCAVLFGQGKINFPCLVTCTAFFTLRDLQLSLPPKLFSIIAQKKQLDEVKAAGIEDLRCCPYCNFAYIPQPEDTIFRCLNEICLKQTCLACSNFAHAPQTCDQVKEEKRREHYTELEMTKSLVRTCYSCHMNFIQEDGCNKMVCPCGSIMCYICKKPIQDYSHFNGDGGNKYWLCPLFSDTTELHRCNLKDAKRRISVELNNNEVKKSKKRDERKKKTKI